jgi:glycosyltransferase involved in cell wall biosynthesis
VSIRVLVITHEPLRQNLSGPGIRALEIARVLSRRQPVTLASPYPPELSDPRVTLAEYALDRPELLKGLASRADVILVQGFTLSQFPFLAELGVPIVVDLYCPFTIEHLEMITSRPWVADVLAAATSAGAAPSSAVDALEADANGVLSVQNTQLLLGDFFLCASERQRDFWIGALHTAGRINPYTYAADRSLRSLIDVVPFGVADERIAAGGPPVMKGARPGIRETDHVLLWAGSVLDWQDPLTLVRAVASIASRRDDLKLFFMGTRHPNPIVPPMRAVQESMSLAEELGIRDKYVFFNDWVPYGERSRYLREADLGLSTHREHLETRFSFRTRMLDYLWSGLPIVCTDGDVFASLVAQRHLGAVVPPGDVDALATAIVRLIDDPDERTRCRARLLETAEEFRWERVVAPLARFCEAPHLAPDRISRALKAQRDIHAQQAQSFRLTRRVKRFVLALGVSQQTILRVKALKPAVVVLGWMNRLSTAWDRKSSAP